MILIRRPPVFSIHESRWVPEKVSLDEVDEAWSGLCADNPKYHDGGVLHVLGVVRNGHGGVSMHLAESSYRFHAVRKLGIDTGIRPLGVKGFATYRDQVLVGRRSDRTGSYPGCWEYVPGGGVEPPVAGGVIDTCEVLRRELHEESGWITEGPVVPVAVFLDEVVGTWEVLHTVAVAPAPDTTAEDPPPGWEYDELRLVQPGECPEPVSDAAVTISSLADSLVSGS